MYICVCICIWLYTEPLHSQKPVIASRLHSRYFNIHAFVPELQGCSLYCAFGDVTYLCRSHTRSNITYTQILLNGDFFLCPCFHSLATAPRICLWYYPLPLWCPRPNWRFIAPQRSVHLFLLAPSQITFTRTSLLAMEESRSSTPDTPMKSSFASPHPAWLQLQLSFIMKRTSHSIVPSIVRLPAAKELWPHVNSPEYCLGISYRKKTAKFLPLQKYSRNLYS